MVSHSNERKTNIKIYRKNPPRGKLARVVTVQEEKSVLDSYEASNFLQITRRWLYALMKNMKVPYKKRGGRYFFRVIDLDRWLVKTKKRNLFSSSPKTELWLGE